MEWKGKWKRLYDRGYEGVSYSRGPLQGLGLRDLG